MAEMHPEAFARIAEATSSSERSYGHLLVLASGGELPSARRIAAFAKGLRLDEFNARQWLLRTTPRVLRREETASKVREWVQWLGALGIDGFQVAEADLLAHQFVPVQGLQFTEWDLVLELAGGEAVRLPKPAVSLLVASESWERVRRERFKRAVTGEPGALLASEVAEERTQIVIDLHVKVEPRTFRIEQDEFRWSSVFPSETGQTSVLVRRLLALLKERLPGVPCREEGMQRDALLLPTREHLASETVLQSRWLAGSSRIRAERQVETLESNWPALTFHSLLVRAESAQSLHRHGAP